MCSVSRKRTMIQNHLVNLLMPLSKRKSFRIWVRAMIGLLNSRAQCLRVWECARKLWETLCRSIQNLAIWASQRMLFDPTKTFSFFYIYFIAKFLSCFGIRTEEIQLTALKNFQVAKALVVAAEKIPSNVPNHRFETWSLHILDGLQLIKNFCGLLHEAVSETRMAC